MDSTEFVKSQKNSLDKINAVVAASVFLISIIIYYLTKAPTFSFWDCGEFIACSYILGIPHPPGSPLYIIAGRVFSILPIAADIAVRINLFSVVTSAVAALFGYLLTVRLIRFWFEDRDDIYSRITIYIGGFTGALFMAFSNTNWANSVEAEVYAPTTMLMTIIYWLALRYFDSRETPRGSRIMLLLVYLAMLGVGIHLSLFAIVPAAGLYFILKKEAGTREWALVSFFFFAELYLIFQLSSRPGEVPFYLPILILFILLLFHTVLMRKPGRPVLISVGLFLICLYPLYFIIVDAVSENITGFGLAAPLETLSTLPVGWVGLAGLILWGIFCIFKYVRGRGEEEVVHEWLTPAIYSLAPAVLLLIGQLFRGYNAFLIITVVIMLAVAIALWRQINWLVLIGLGAISMIILGFWQFFWGLILGSAAVVILGIILKDKNWKTAICIILLAILGYSIHAYIPIRSAHNPNIDENNPSRSTAAMIGYLERKQYGSQAMTSRMFVRRGEWKNQFGDYKRMGYWRFFKEQYGLNGSRFFIVLILGLFGIWETIRRKPKIGLPFFVVVVLCSIGFVLYMNFADGTRQHPITGADYIEVRNRDYFFTPAFVFFGLAIGMGIAAFIDLVRDTFRNFGPTLRNTAFGVSSLLVFMPLFPLTNNYFYNDRSRNYMPYDYAENYLKSCGKDAIFLTNGDNDTFPVWCIQEVYGVRTDVRVVNLSLANTKWYMKQLRDKLKVPITLTDEQIDRIVSFRDEKGVVYRMQDQLVDHIITANRWKYPINMAVTVPEESRRYRGRPLNDHLILEGMVFTLTPTPGEDQMNYDLTRRMYEEEYKYRGIADPTIYKDESSQRLVNNYAQGFILLADSLAWAEDYDSALEHVRKGLKVLPQSFDLYAYASQLFARMGKIDTMEIFIESAPVKEKWKLYFNWGISAKLAGKLDDAINVLEKTHRLYPDYADAFRALATIYYQNKYYSKLRKIVESRVERHPEDNESKELLRQIQNIDAARDTVEGAG